MKKDQFNLFPEQKKKMIDEIMYFFDKELDQDIGELKAYTVLDFILQEFAVDFYNKGLEDAGGFLQGKIEDLYGLEKVKDKRR